MRTESLCERQIVVLRVERIEHYGAYLRLHADHPDSVLVLITEISWAPVRHPSLALRVGDEVEVLVLRHATEHEWVGSIRLLDPDHPYAPFETMEAGRVLRGRVDAQFGGQVFLDLDDYPNAHASAPCGGSDRPGVGSDVEVAFKDLDRENWFVRVELLPQH